MTETDNERIDEIADQYDVSREEAIEIAERLQGDAEDPVICAECGRHEAPDKDLYITRYKTPDGGHAALDWECYAELLQETTTLSERESQAIALTRAGLSHGEAADILDVARGQIGRDVGRARNKAQEAPEQIERLYATLEVMADDLNAEP